MWLKFLQIIYESDNCDFIQGFIIHDFENKNCHNKNDHIYLLKTWIKIPVLNHSQRFNK